MKIISSYKDYYDYLQGIRGVDPLVILDRRKGNPKPNPSNSLNVVNIIICDRHYELFYYQNKWISAFEFHNLTGDYILRDRYRDYDNKWEIRSTVKESQFYTRWVPDFCKPPADHYRKIERNDNYPAIIWSPYRFRNKDLSEHHSFPRLEDFDLASMLPATEIWDLLYNFLSKTDQTVDNMSDSEKILSHGFDLKSSFRPKIKK